MSTADQPRQEIVSCPHCGGVTPLRLEAGGGETQRVRCSTCQQTFTVNCNEAL